MLSLYREHSGKISADAFMRIVYPNLGKGSRDVLIGPMTGVDASVIKLKKDFVLLVSSDPMSYLPELGAEDSAYLSVSSVCNDILASGVQPEYASFVMNLPPTMKETEFQKYWKAVSSNCARMGITIIAGHTGFYEGLGFSIVGSGTVFATCKRNRFVSSSFAKPGDKLIMTKGAGVETTALIPRLFPETVKKELGERVYEEAVGYLRYISIYEDSLAAVSAGVRRKGVTAMHDVAEGGVLGAILELAEASSTGMYIFLDRIPVSEVTEKICSLFSLDPLTTMGEGSLLISVTSSREKAVLSSLNRAGVQAVTIGRVTKKEFGRIALSDGSESKLSWPAVHAYWNAIKKAREEGLR